MTLDIEQIRADTPGCINRIHFHNSGSSLMPKAVYDATVDHLQLELNIGGYEAAAQSAERIDQFYSATACMLGCAQSEVAYMENATAAFNSVFYGFARKLGVGDRILTANAEYASNFIAYLHVASITGCEIDVIPNDANGQIDCEALETMIDERVKLISITHVPTNCGLVNPAAAVGEVASRHGIPYLLDACQSAGQMPLDVATLKVDAMTVTGRKYLRGPRGTGFLYIRESAMDHFPPASLDLHGARWVELDRFEMSAGASRHENFENNVAGQIGLGVAIDYALALGLDNIYQRIQYLADRLRQRLGFIDGITLADQGIEKCGIVAFAHRQIEPAVFRARLGAMGINVGTSNARSTLLDMRSRGIESVVRCAVHYFNTEEEIDRLMESIKSVISNK